MFEELEVRRKRFDGYGPFDGAAQVRLNKFFEPWLIWSSNALEGNTMTLGDTIYLLQEGRLPSGKSEDEYLEVKGQQAAYAYAREVVAKGFHFSEKLIREIHQLLTEKLDSNKYLPGQYKDRDNQVLQPDGTVFPYVSCVDTPAAMGALLSWYDGPGAQLHPVERAAWLHYKAILIHPFRDGNGRTVRMLTNLSLMQAGYLPAVFRAAERRPIYLGALHEVDRSVPRETLTPDNPDLKLFPFLSYVEQELLWSYDRALDVVEGRLSVQAEDLVAGFVGVEDRALRAAGLGPDAQARLDQMVLSVEEMGKRVEGLLRGVVAASNARSREFHASLAIQNAPAIEALSEAGRGSIQEMRRTALGLGGASVSGKLSVVALKFVKNPQGVTSATPPPAWCEFLAYAEPHVLQLGFHLQPGMRMPGPESGISVPRIPFSLDPQSWRDTDIERFVVEQTDRFLRMAANQVDLANGGT